MEHRLTATERQAALAPVAAARGLPNRAYTSPDWAAAERDGLLGRTWTCLGFADEVPARHAVPMTLLGLPLVAVRGLDDAIRVFHNVCRHRGHKLVDQPKRLVTGFVCPYHCWTYGFDGALKKTPHIGGVGIHETAGFDKDEHPLAPVRTAVWLGMIFVNLSADAPDFAEHIAPLQERWAAFAGPEGLARLVAQPAQPDSALVVRGNWKLAVENYCESYHLPFVHPALNRYSKLSDHYNILAGDWGAGQGTTVFNYAERAGVSFPTFPDWPMEKRRVAEYIALFPNVLLGLQVDHAFAMILKPVAHDRTEESVRLYFVEEAAALDERHGAARQTLLKDWMAVFAEDIGVVEGMQQGRASPGYDGGAFSPFHDTPTHHFHGWVARRMAGEEAADRTGEAPELSVVAG